MGMRVIWIVFGAAMLYLIAAVLVPIVIVALRGGGVAIADETAASITRLAALISAPFGGALGMRHALKVEERRSAP